MRAYSIDLRERVLRDSDAGLPAAVVAVQYHVSASWVRRLKQRRRETGGVYLLWRGAAGAAVRSDAGRRHRGWAPGHGRARDECRVPALCRALGLPGARLSAVPGTNEGQGRAADSLLSAELLLRAHVCRRRRPQRPGGALVRDRRQRPAASDDGRAAPAALTPRSDVRLPAPPVGANACSVYSAIAASGSDSAP